MLDRFRTFLGKYIDDSYVMGSGSYTNWSGDGLITFYNPGQPGGAGPAIHVNGYTRWEDANTVPGLMGVHNGFRGLKRINYLTRGTSKLVLSLNPAKDFMEIAKLQIGTFNSIISVDKAIESVTQKNRIDSKPVTEVEKAKEIEQVKAGGQGGKVIDGYYFQRDSFENGEIKYRGIRDDGEYEESADSSDWVKSL